MGDLAVGKGYLVEKFMGAGKQSEARSVNVSEWLQGTTEAGTSRAGAVNLGVEIPKDLHITPEMADKLDKMIDQGYKIMGNRDMSTRLSRFLSWLSE